MLKTLFLVYINDLHLSINHSEVNMYADDTSISFSSNSIRRLGEGEGYSLGERLGDWERVEDWERERVEDWERVIVSASGKQETIYRMPRKRIGVEQSLKLSS